MFPGPIDHFEELLFKVNKIKEEKGLQNLIKISGNINLQYKIKDNNYYLWVPLAGFSRENILCSYEKNILNLNAYTKQLEYKLKDIQEKIEFQKNISSVKASFKDGLLQLIVSTSIEEQKIEINIDG